MTLAKNNRFEKGDFLEITRCDGSMFCFIVCSVDGIKIQGRQLSSKSAKNEKYKRDVGPVGLWDFSIQEFASVRKLEASEFGL